MLPDCSQVDPANRKVLVVDDDPMVRKTIVRMVHALGLCVVEAASGNEALSLLSKANPTAIILDLFMPGMDGIEMLCAMRAKSYKTPVIAITGGSGTEAALATTFARKLGAAVLLNKPFKLDQLASAFEVALGQSPLACPVQPRP